MNLHSKSKQTFTLPRRIVLYRETAQRTLLYGRPRSHIDSTHCYRCSLGEQVPVSTDKLNSERSLTSHNGHQPSDDKLPTELY